VIEAVCAPEVVLSGSSDELDVGSSGTGPPDEKNGCSII
jgi:hypothetical protein